MIPFFIHSALTVTSFITSLGRGSQASVTVILLVVGTGSVQFRVTENWSLEIHGADLDPGPTNLITKAALLLSERTGHPLKAKIVLRKIIPIGGGLGGGSSNGSITLLGLNELWSDRP